MPVTWSDADDAVVGGDLTTALTYRTPAGGAVIAAVAPIGLRDRERGTITFTTDTGWLEVGDDGTALYAPHTETGFRAPANKTLLLLGNGFLARQGLRRARREAAA